MSVLKPGLEARLRGVEEELRRVVEKAGRPAGSVKLLAVGKTFPAEAVAQCLPLGVRAFGENYVQEGAAKVEWFREHYPDVELEWHLIGPLQSNKTRVVAEHFDWVQSVDRLKIAERLNAQRPAGMKPLQVLIEVNIDDSPTKSGLPPAEVEQLADAIDAMPNLTLRGLMCIPAPADTSEGRLKPLLAMKAFYDEFKKRHPQVDTLSMGMTRDMDEAVAAGSTMVRVGTAIFGPRDYGQRTSQ